MTISINCTIEELKEKATILQKATEGHELNQEYWLNELQPSENNFSDIDDNPYESLIGDERKQKFREWFSVYKNEYEKPRSKILEKILDDYLQIQLNEDSFTKVRNLLITYRKHDTGPIAYKAGLLLEKYDLERLILESIIEIDEETDEWKIADLFSYLNGFEYENELSEDTVNRLIKLMQQASVKNYKSTNPYFHLFRIFNKLAPKYPKLLASMQGNLVKLLDLDHLSYDDYDSAIYMVSNSWEHISFYWSDESKRKLIDTTIEIAEDELEPGDAFVEDGVLRALKLIGKDDEKAQEVINKIEKELEEYYAEDENEDEDDE